MTSWRCPLAVLAFLVTPATVTAEHLHCLGQDPGFMLVLSQTTARLDYLGDGVFDVTPPVPQDIPTFTRHSLVTAGGALPVFVERRPCEVLGLTLPFAVELGLPANGGRVPANGCCREVAPE